MGESELTQAALVALAAEYAAELPGLIAELAGLVEAGAADPATLRRASAAAHRLRGTAGSYGFIEVSTVAGSIEDALEAGATTALTLAVHALLALAPQPSAGSSGSSK